MALFRYFTEKDDKYVELSYEGMSYKKNPISVCITQKKAEGTYSKIEDLQPITYTDEQAKEGFIIKSSLGQVKIKWVTRFWIISEMQVFIDDYKLAGSEIIRIEGFESGKYI
jgi:hypothetical protein